MFESPNFWVLVAFVLFFLIFGKKMFSFLREVLGEHKNKISRQLDEAQRLQEEAFQLLETYKKKHQDAMKQAEDILSFAQEEAATLKREKELEFEKFMKQREKTFHERIENEKEEAIASLRKQVLDEAIQKVEAFLLTKLAEKKKITQAAVKEIAELSRNSKKTSLKK